MVRKIAKNINISTTNMPMPSKSWQRADWTQLSHLGTCLYDFMVGCIDI